MEWNSSELRAGVDKWPETQAAVTNIEQVSLSAGNDSFLSVITFRFKDGRGEYFEGNFRMRTDEMPDDLMTGSTISIRYNPKNPNKSWSEYDYYRSGFGRFQSFDYPVVMLVMVGVFLLLIAVIEIFHIHAR